MSTRLGIVAIAIGLASSMTLQAQENKPEPEIQPDATQEQPAEQPAVEPPPVEPTIPLPANEASAEHDESSAKDTQNKPQQIPSIVLGDGWAQWAMALTGLGALLVSIWAVRLLKATLKETRDAVRAADDAVGVTREIGEAQTRAYLSLEEVKALVDERDGINFAVTIRNLGNTPARDVHVVVGVWVNREIEMPEDFGGGVGQVSVEIYSRPLKIGDIEPSSRYKSGIYKTHGLSFPVDVSRNQTGLISAGAGNVGVFAYDIFGKEIFHADATLVAVGEEQFFQWEQSGNFKVRGILPVFGGTKNLRARGWREYEEQYHPEPSQLF